MALNKRVKKTQRGLGRSDTARMVAMYPASPTEDYEPDSSILVDGVVTENDQTGPVDLDYNESPSLELGDMYPNTSSPGPGSDNPEDQVEPKPEYEPSGAGSTDDPKEGAERISRQKIGELIKGSSSPV